MEILSLNYTLSKSAAHKGLCEWYFLKNRVKNLIYSIIFAVLSVNFLLSAIFLKDTMSIFLLFVSIFAACMMFAVPPFQLKSYANAYGDGENFCLKLFEDKIEVTSATTHAEIDFSEITAVFDCKNFLCLQTKVKLFPIVKTQENAEKTEKLASFLKEKLPNCYKKINKP